MNKYRREVTIEILVGLFMFTVLIALGIFTIVLSQENLLKKSYAYEIIFPEIGGLREGDNVYLRGMSVGRVKQTELEQQARVRVYVTMDVPLELRLGYQMEIIDASMLGGKILKIYEGPDEAPTMGDHVTLLGEMPRDLVAELGVAVNGIQRMISSISNGDGTLGKLLHDDELYNNLARSSASVKKIVTRIEHGEGSLGQLLASDDGQMYADGKKVFANFRILSQNLADGEGLMGKLMSGDAQAFEDLEASLVAFRSISESISAGEGTIGRLVRDAQLYDEATLLVEDVRAAVDDLREASPITSFGSVLFGAF